MKCSHLIGGAIFASALLGSAAFAFAEDAAPPADTGAAPPAADAAAAPAPKVAKKATKPAAAAMWTGKALQVGQYDGKPIVAYAALGKQAMPSAEAPAPTSAPAAKGAAPAQ